MMASYGLPHTAGNISGPTRLGHHAHDSRITPRVGIYWMFLRLPHRYGQGRQLRTAAAAARSRHTDRTWGLCDTSLCIAVSNALHTSAAGGLFMFIRYPRFHG